MENPASLVQRAALNRRQKAAVPTAPIREEPQGDRAPAPVHTSSHASYTALMRSHDRVATRHIAPRAGA